jgi:hypothetical protein
LINSATIQVVSPANLHGLGGKIISIDIKFLQNSESFSNKITNCYILSLLKLCFLKEISTLFIEEKIKLLPEKIRTIIKILSKGF